MPLAYARTPFFLNPSDCLYIKMNCDFIQIYETKLRMQIKRQRIMPTLCP